MTSWKRMALAAVLLPGVLLAQIRISEVFYDPVGSDGGQEWVELVNQGAAAVNIGGWLLDLSGPNFVLPPLEVPSGATVLIHSNADAPQPPSGLELWFVAGQNLGNTHGFVGLWEAEQQSVEFMRDYMEYGQPGHSWESQAVEAGVWVEGGFVGDVETGMSLVLTGEGFGPEFWDVEENPVPGDETTAVLELTSIRLLVQDSVVRLEWEFTGRVERFSVRRRVGEGPELLLGEVLVHPESTVYEYVDSRPLPGSVYFLYLHRPGGGEELLAGPLQPAAGIDEGRLPESPRLLEAWPNPFNPDCNLRFEMPGPGSARLVLYDLTGREVKVVHEGELSAGIHDRRLELAEAPGGPYFLALETGSSRSVMKLLLLK